MDDAFFMRGFERLGDLTRDCQRLIERDGALRQTIRQRGSFDQLQHERRQVAGFFETVEGRDMRVVQRGQEFRFPSESRASIGVAGESPRQDFHRDVPLQPRVARAVHLAHAALAELAFDAVWPEECPSRKHRARRIVRGLRTGLNGSPIQKQIL